MVADVATALAALGTRELMTGEEDSSSPETSASSWTGRPRWSVKRALDDRQVRQLRFHDLRHTFGTLAVRRAEVPTVQPARAIRAIQTTMRYAHVRDRGREAELFARPSGSSPTPRA